MTSGDGRRVDLSSAIVAPFAACHVPGLFFSTRFRFDCRQPAVSVQGAVQTTNGCGRAGPVARRRGGGSPPPPPRPRRRRGWGAAARCPEIIALALASGAAAALSLSTGISSALVGVMVAVALLPPSVASALFLGAGDYQSAIGAAILLALNVVCAVLSAQLVFVYKGIRPRTWSSQKKASRSVKINAIVWLGLLIALAALAYSLNPVLT